MQLYKNTEEEQPLSVSELNDYIKEILENNFRSVFVVGEISGYKRSFPSGHSYFTLKDEDSQISCNLWSFRFNQLRFQPEDGKKVLIRGSLRIYKLRGTYSIDVTSIEEFGLGELQLKFEELKKKLAAEGLFDNKYKKELPEFPEKIAVVTSETGAVLADIKRVAAKRYPSVKLFLYPVLVQGKGSSESVCSAIESANRSGISYDIILVARGGGSIEDLWTFNEETVARAVFKSKIPVVSAIGHEVDYTICDFVADLRAPTPSAAAEMILPDKTELLGNLELSGTILNRYVRDRLKYLESSLENIEKSYSFNKPKDLIRDLARRVDEISDDMQEMISGRFNNINENLLMSRRNLLNSFKSQGEKIKSYRRNFKEIDSRLNIILKERMKRIRYDIIQQKKLLDSLNPETILKRGFTYITRGEKILSRKSSAKINDYVNIHFTDGKVGAEIRDDN